MDTAASRLGAHSYRRELVPDVDQTEIVACSDIVEEYAEAYREYHKIPKAYTDFHEMLAEENLDIVSIITWPHLHADRSCPASARCRQLK